jgi:hypothetical protein
MTQKLTLCSLPPLSQTKANPKVQPSVPPRACIDPSIRRAVRPLQRHGLQNTMLICRLPKIKRFNTTAPSAALRSLLAASSATTRQTPTVNGRICGPDHQSATNSHITATLGQVVYCYGNSKLLVENKFIYSQQ